MSIKENIAYIRAEIDKAARATGRTGEDITLVGASKMNDAAACQEAIAAGIDVLGENRVQEMTEKLAQNANLSPIYFHKLFRAHLGMTPAAFVLSCRIAAAKALLKTGESAISEISARCGFSSQSYFNYKFKEITGETPLQYRKARLSRLTP